MGSLGVFVGLFQDNIFVIVMGPLSVDYWYAGIHLDRLGDCTLVHIYTVQCTVKCHYVQVK